MHVLTLVKLAAQDFLHHHAVLKDSLAATCFRVCSATIDVSKRVTPRRTPLVPLRNRRGQVSPKLPSRKMRLTHAMTVRHSRAIFNRASLHVKKCITYKKVDSLATCPGRVFLSALFLGQRNPDADALSGLSHPGLSQKPLGPDDAPTGWRSALRSSTVISP